MDFKFTGDSSVLVAPWSPKRIDDETSSTQYAYYCAAMPGTAEDAAAWQIARFEWATGKTTHPNGSARFNFKASERLTLTYA